MQPPLDAVRRTLEPARDFVPAESARSFSLSCIDTTQVIVLPRLLGALARDASGVGLDMRPLPSAGDTSYAGVVLRDGTLWIDYYCRRVSSKSTLTGGQAGAT